jgi:lysophospholipase
MKYTELQINAADGTMLRVIYRVPQHFHSMVIIVHGLGEHCGRYDEVATFFNKRGFATFLYDHRGHGKSSGKRAHIDSFEEYLSDLMIVSKKGIEVTKTEKFLLFGHSMGGLISANFAGRKPELLSGLVLSSPFIGNAVKIPAVKAIAGKLLSRLVPGFSMPTGLPPEMLSHDHDVVQAYINDPLVTGSVTTRWFTETVKGQLSAFEAARKYTGPLLVLQGGDDQLVSVTETKAFFEVSASPDKEIHVLEGLYHEIFNEVERKIPFGLLDEWLKKHPAIMPPKKA